MERVGWAPVLDGRGGGWGRRLPTRTQAQTQNKRTLPPPLHAQLLFKRAQSQGADAEAVDYVEFLAATLHLGRLELDDRLWRAFRHFDAHDTGFISRADLVGALGHLGKKVRERDGQERAEKINQNQNTGNDG